MESTIATTRDDLKRLLVERRRTLLREMQTKIRDVRAEAVGTCRQGNEPGEPSETDQADDLAFALLNMKSQVLNHNQRGVTTIRRRYLRQLRRLWLAFSRLRALPFALRCKGCEQQREFARATRPRAGASRIAGPGVRHPRSRHALNECDAKETAHAFTTNARGACASGVGNQHCLRAGRYRHDSVPLIRRSASSAVPASRPWSRGRGESPPASSAWSGRGALSR